MAAPVPANSMHLKSYNRGLYLMHRAVFMWEYHIGTTSPDSMGNVVTKSDIFCTHTGTEYESKWQFEVETSYVDAHGTRHLSFWIRLLHLHPSKQNLKCFFDVNFRPCHDTRLNDKRIGLENFSRETPCIGIKNLIPYYTLNSKAGHKLFFRVKMFLLTDPDFFGNSSVLSPPPTPAS